MEIDITQDITKLIELAVDMSNSIARDVCTNGVVSEKTIEIVAQFSLQYQALDDTLDKTNHDLQ